MEPGISTRMGAKSLSREVSNNLRYKSKCIVQAQATNSVLWIKQRQQ